MVAATARPARAVIEDPAATVLDLQARIRAMQGVDLGEKRLPTHPAVAEVFPDGALVGGSAYHVAGSTTLLQAVLAGPSLAGGWCAVVGMPDFGVEAAAAAGIDLERLVLLPKPGERWWPVLSALVETMTAVAVHPPALPAAGDLARLQGKLRTSDGILVVDRTSGASLVLHGGVSQTGYWVGRVWFSIYRLMVARGAPPAEAAK